MPMSNTDKYILAGVIFFIVVVTIILVYLNLRRKHHGSDKHHGSHKHHDHTEVPCPTECAKKLENEDDEEDCKCGA
jgi:hypothetical protein